MFFVRPARKADAPTIRAMVWAARLNPISLNWRRFLVAEDAGQVIGIGQIKPHGDGSYELASLAVVRERQSSGVGGALIQALLATAPPTVFLTCRGRLVGYYQRFGFREVSREEMTPYFRRLSRLADVLIALFRYPERMAVMRRDATPQ